MELDDTEVIDNEDDNMGLDAPEIDEHLEMLESNMNSDGMDELYV
jgi:hypothetical protein